MEQPQSKSNIIGLIALFLLFIPAGIIVSYLYIGIANLIGNVWLHAFAAFGAGGALFAVVFFLKKLFKITNNVGACIAVALGLPLIHYLKWVFYFVFVLTEFNPFLDASAFLGESWTVLTTVSFSNFISFLRELNYYGWEIVFFGSDSGIPMRGILLGAVWVAELLIISALPLASALIAAGVYLFSYNAWAKPRYLEYNFETFTEEERERIATGNIDVILGKPIIIDPAQGEGHSLVAVCYVKEEPTEYIALYGAAIDNKGNINRSILSQAINIGKSKIAELEAQLAEKHAIAETADDNAEEATLENSPE